MQATIHTLVPATGRASRPVSAVTVCVNAPASYYFGYWFSH
ncbi:hypothetical protein B2J77_10535 [Pseudomonas parafulva]|uniref:Uncharacterized protein n=1 Tax=Pseudomonas parafulva TaxID=157782 RepID=A0ABN4XTX7_9PSED|nr:hypothetical protein B2J77_10535 [Pseudomonas parafulva]